MKKMAVSTKKRVLFVIAPADFKEEELLGSKAVLDRAAGIETAIASRKAGIIKGAGGGKAKAALSFDDVKVQEFDAIAFIGGHGAAAYFGDAKARQIAKQAFDEGKIVAAICIAPSILANAGILKGKKATGFSSQADNLREKGAEYTGQPVTRDGKAITANGPSAAKKFGEEILKALLESGKPKK
jgi:protease I